MAGREKHAVSREDKRTRGRGDVHNEKVPGIKRFFIGVQIHHEIL